MVKLLNKKNLWRIGYALCLLFYVGIAAAATDMSIGGVAKNITDSMSDLAKLITAGSYVAGFGFAIGAILKFKAHKENPQQIPVGTPIAFLLIATALIFLPGIFGVAGKTMLGNTSAVGGVTGVTSF
jgi:intracellular multiplication protein IcmD